jgi:SAM-dependent methyltransferase
MGDHKCNFCGTELTHVFCDLGFHPPSNKLLTKEELSKPEITYPLVAYVCDQCWLVQVPDCGAKLFDDGYPYYSSQSPSNVSHAKEYVDKVVERFRYNEGSLVLEVGSNDGYLLQWFKEKDIKVMGIDPSGGPVDAARNKGIPTYQAFFSESWAKDHAGQFDLICGINVLAHQPDINDFVKGLKAALKVGGVITFEFPWLVRMVDGRQFDTIYHEHFSYFSLTTVCRIFAEHGLEVFDVEELEEHGGSLRIYAQHKKTDHTQDTETVADLLRYEIELGVKTLDYYEISWRYYGIRNEFLRFLMDCSDRGNMVVGYGAAAKAATLLNSCKVTDDLMYMVVDRSPHKQGKYLPGSHIRIGNEEELRGLKPDYVVILPWNLKEEIMEQLGYIREWDGSFVTVIPRLGVE